MKILQVNAVNKILSTGHNCSEISEYINNNGDMCYTAYSTGKETQNSFRIAGTVECKYHALMSRISGKQGYYSYFATNKLLNITIFALIHMLRQTES